MHLLLLHMRYAPELTGTAPLITQLAEHLAAEDIDVTVATSVPHYGMEDVQHGYGRKLISRSTINGVNVWRTAAFPWASGSILGRTIDYLLYMVLSVVIGLRGEQPDLVHCVAPPITVGLSGWLVARLRGAPMSYNAQDIWPDALVQMGQLRSGGMTRLLHLFERWVYRVAAAVIVVSEGMRSNLMEKGVPDEKVVVLPNWVDLDAIEPLPPELSLRPHLGIEDRFVILFSGNVGYAAGLETVFSAARRVSDQGEILFLIVGDGSAKDGLVELAGEMGLENVQFLPTQPPDRLSQTLATADLALVPLRATMGPLSVPSKALAYMASARPLLAAVPPDSEITTIVRKAACGWLIPPEDPEAMAAKILELAAEPSDLEARGGGGRQYVEQHYGKDRILSEYALLLRELASASA